MKLTEGKLVQWKDDKGAWHRGRMLIKPNSEFCLVRMGDDVLVKHSYTQELEFVLGTTLVPQPEEHPE
jgi:hypothetical protein